MQLMKSPFTTDLSGPLYRRSILEYMKRGYDKGTNIKDIEAAFTAMVDEKLTDVFSEFVDYALNALAKLLGTKPEEEEAAYIAQIDEWGDDYCGIDSLIAYFPIRAHGLPPEACDKGVFKFAVYNAFRAIYNAAVVEQHKLCEEMTDRPALLMVTSGNIGGATQDTVRLNDRIIFERLLNATASLKEQSHEN